jgi:WD40 repeat protein
MEQMDGRELTRRTDIYSWAVSVMEMYLGARPWANGVVAGMNCKGYFEQSRVPMPKPMQELLSWCMACEQENRPHDFAGVEAELLKIYSAEMGVEYLRPVPKAAADTADSLNNRALSFLDLGMPWKAEECFVRAKNQNASHSESIYNHALLKWRNGQIDDQSMIGICQELNWNESAHDKSKLTAAVHLERGDVENAMALHDGSVWSKTENAVIQDLLAQRKADGQQEVRFEKYYYTSRLEDNQVVTNAPYDVNTASPAALDKIGAFYAFNHRGDRLALKRKDNQKAYILDMHTGELSTECLCHDAQINDLVFSMDDQRIASGDLNGCIKVWDALTLECVTTINTDNYVFALCFSADGKRLYSGGFSGEIKVWDARNGVLLKTLMSSTGDVRKLAISADGTKLISGNTFVGQIWDTKTGKCMITLFHEICSGKALISADGSYAAVTRSRFFSESGSETFSVKHVPSSRYLADWVLCRISASARQIETDAAYEQYAEAALRQLDEDRPLEALDTIAQARRLCGMRDDHFLLDLYVEAASRLKRGKLAHVWLRGSVPSANAHFCCIAISPDSTRLFVLSQSGICVYSTDNQGKTSEMPVKLPARISCACFDPSGRYLFIGSVDERSVTKIDVATGKKEGSISTKGIDHPTDFPKDLSISDCGKYLLISTAFSKLVYVYSVAACTLVARLASERFDMNGASMFYGGAYGISASQASGCNVRAIGLPSQLSKLVGSVGYPTSRDHTKFIWFASPRQLRVCSVEEPAGAPARITGASDFSAACFTPDSKHVITSDHSNAVTLWDTSGVKEAELCRTVSRGYRLCVSLNGRYLAVQMADSSTQLVELEWSTELPSHEDLNDILPHLKNFRVYQPYYSKDELLGLERKLKSIGGGWMAHDDLTAMLPSIRPGRVLTQAPKGKRR